jgi:zinc transport system substrate-binding protein
MYALALIAVLLGAPPAPPAARPLKIGVTLHPYYSWTMNIVGDLPNVEVRPILPGEIDAGDYQPSPKDIQKITDLDAIVINGIGHDDFIRDMIKASGNGSLTLIEPNRGTPLLRATHGEGSNSHTFISFSNAISQTYYIEKALAALRPEYAAIFHANAAEYVHRLRKIKGDAAARLADAKISRVVTVHDGYSYLLQELGIELVGVVEPSHGLIPSAKELAEMVKLIQREKVQVILSEATFPANLLKVLTDETGARVTQISHIATGVYSADEFERQMQANANALVSALTPGSNGP